jgi:O-antigen biosynthesis protein
MKKIIKVYSILKSEGIKALLVNVKNRIARKIKYWFPNKNIQSLSRVEIPIFSGVDKEKFWRVINPIIEQKKSGLNSKSPVKISILTPTWNSSLDWFIATVLSVLNQSSSDWEWCIVDDGSKDAELCDILTELSQKYPRIKLDLQRTGGGISFATNKALELATGDYICFLDHDDTLDPTAIQTLIDKMSEGFDVVYSDEDKIDFSGKSYTEPFFKPDWSPEYFCGVMYVGHLLCLRRDLAIAVGGCNKKYDGVQDYEFMLRVSAQTQKIGHIPKILYHWRKIRGSIAADINAKPKIEELQANAVNAHLQYTGLLARAEGDTGNHRVKIVPLPRKEHPLISIVIPTRDAPVFLERCLKSIFTRTEYSNYEVILVDNQTTDTKALQVMTEFPVKCLNFADPFNYSRANNLGSKLAQGDYLVFLNNDTEVLTKDWLEHLLYYAEQPNIGAVGSLLLFPDKTVQHAGLVMGLRGTADHIMRGFPHNVDGYAGSLVCAREVSGVTAACMMVKKSNFEEIGMFNEHFFTHYQDVDLCMRFVRENKKNIFTPQSVLIHYESTTRKSYYDTLDRMLLLDQWQDYIDKGDPFYNPNFNLAYWDYTIQTIV